MGKVTFRAKWKKDLFRSDDFAVAIMEDCKTGKEYKCTGALVPSAKNVRYEIEAEEKENTKYGGMEYRITSCAMSKHSGKEEMTALLSSGIFPGIGPQTAEKLYAKFGDSVLEVIENEPSKLTVIKGITRTKAEKISKSFKDNTAETELYRYMAPFGFTVKQIHKVRQISTTPALIDFVTASPYTMMRIRGVTFGMADLLARDNGIEEDATERIRAAAEQVLRDNMRDGHVGMKFKALTREMVKLLNTDRIDNDNIGSLTADLIENGWLAYRKIKDGNDVLVYIYLPHVLNAEKELARLIYSNSCRSTGLSEKRVMDELSRFERNEGMQLDPGQKEAVMMALTNGLSVITGGPGTGKTTIIKALASIWQSAFHGRKEVALMSPTGRAARRITEQTGMPASTIHSGLKLGIADDTGVREDEQAENTITDALVIVDEFSMVDMFLARDMMKNLKDCVVIFVGDSDQLPSVGCGKVLSDILESRAIPVTRLEYIHRQEEGSNICTNADLIRHGQKGLKAGDDFVILLLPDGSGMRQDATMQKIEDKMVSEYRRLTDLYGEDNVAMLCPFNKHPGGQQSINKRMQEELNPYERLKKQFRSSKGDIFRVGDPVMQLINTEEVSNGEVGRAIAVDRVDGRDVLAARYFDTTVTYTQDEAENVALAYAMTVHKSQGSEYDAIITCLTDFHGPMAKRNIIYTAITRARKQVVLIGNKRAILEAIDNDSTDDRNTMLKYELRSLWIKDHGNLIDFSPKSEEPGNKEECSQLKLKL